MAKSVDLGPRLEQTVNELVSAGRYGSVSEVLREGVRLVQEREARLADINASLKQAMAESEAGLSEDVDVVFDRLEAKLRDRLG